MKICSYAMKSMMHYDDIVSLVFSDVQQSEQGAPMPRLGVKSPAISRGTLLLYASDTRGVSLDVVSDESLLLDRILELLACAVLS